MRLWLVLSLVGLVLLCPSICGAADSGDHAHRQQPASPDDDTPVHCPDEGTSCVCGGAVRPADLRSDHLDLVGLLAPAIHDLSFAPPFTSGTPDLSARVAEEPSLPGPRAARAWLQVYRI